MELDVSVSRPKSQKQETTNKIRAHLPNPQQNLPHQIPQGTKNLAPPLT